MSSGPTRFGSLLLEAGVELAVVSKLLGPPTFATTADIYAHLTPAMSAQAAERMDMILRRQTTTA